MKKKTQTRTRSFKKLSPTGYRYYSKNGKRISKAKYYALQKRRNTRLRKVKVSGQFSKGYDYVKKVSIFFQATTAEIVTNLVDTFAKRVFKHIKRKNDKLLYIQLSGDLLCDERVDIYRSTRLSFLSEYKKDEFRRDEIYRTISKIYDLFNQMFYDHGEVTDFHLKTISINQRD